jgi:hypothetical protein
VGETWGRTKAEGKPAWNKKIQLSGYSNASSKVVVTAGWRRDEERERRFLSFNCETEIRPAEKIVSSSNYGK